MELSETSSSPLFVTYNSCVILLQQVLGTRDLVSLGVGSCVGTGMYLVSGMVAKKMAGPAVVLSYAIAGLAALLSGQ